LEATPEHSSAAVRDGFKTLTDVVEQTGLPTSVVEEALEELIREPRAKLERSLSARWRPHPEDAERVVAASPRFYRVDPAVMP
jgi:hypothetical protein